MQKRGEKVLLEKFPKSCTFSRFGTAEVATDPMGVKRRLTLYIMFKPFDQWRNGKSIAPPTSLTEELGKPVQRNRLCFHQYQMRFNRNPRGTRVDIAVKVFRQGLQGHRTDCQRGERFWKIPGAADVEFDARQITLALEIVPAKPFQNTTCTRPG